MAYIPEGSEHFKNYVDAVAWAQDFARLNREVMMGRTLQAMREVLAISFESHVEAVNCHHNYISREHHYGEDVWVTRKGARRVSMDEHLLATAGVECRKDESVIDETPSAYKPIDK